MLSGGDRDGRRGGFQTRPGKRESAGTGPATTKDLRSVAPCVRRSGSSDSGNARTTADPKPPPVK